MSHQATTWVLEKSECEGIDFIVLFVIANHCHPDGSGAFPSVKTIAAQSRCSERGARYAIERLEQLGELIVKRTKGAVANQKWHSRNDYTIPGVVRDGFCTERSPRPEATVAPGNSKPAAKPEAKTAIPSGNQLPLNNPLEQREQGEQVQHARTAHEIQGRTWNKIMDKAQKRHDLKMAKIAAERAVRTGKPFTYQGGSNVETQPKRSKGEERAERTRKALEILDHPERYPEHLRPTVPAGNKR
jgi:hypothetical protein